MIDRSAKLLRELREARNISTITVAVAIGASRSMVQRWEAGEALPTLRNAARIACFYGVTMDELFVYLADDKP